MKTSEAIRRQGLEVLARELGPVGMVRFLQMFENGSGDYVQDRHHRHDNEAAAAKRNTQAADKVKVTESA